MEDDDEDSKPWTIEEKVEHLLSEERVNRIRLDNRFAKLENEIKETDEATGKAFTCLFVIIGALLGVVLVLLSTLVKKGIISF